MNIPNAKFVILAVLDGWGIAPAGPGNAISLAKTFNFNKLWENYPHTKLKASGREVGLPRGEAGNTETGHENLGAGKIIYQDIARINMSVAEGSFFKNPALLGAINHAKQNNSSLHLMGLVGAGGVHSSLEHLFALFQLAKRENFDRVFLHAFTDGRDSPTTAAQIYIGKINEVIKNEGIGKIATIMGRYWAMDRDQRWDRTEKAYNALTKGVGQKVKSADEAIEGSYKKGMTDEFIEPTIIIDDSGNPVSLIKDRDAVIFFNYRIDRPRQLSKAFLMSDLTASPSFDFDPYTVKYEGRHKSKKEAVTIPFRRERKIENLYFVMLTEYGKPLVDAGAKVAFPPEIIKDTLGEILSNNKIKQLRVAESEKERFVTYYFSGLRESPFELEERIIIPSPNVPTYDQKPAMSAYEITNALIDKLNQDREIRFVLINYANPDMVGHTGNIGPAVKAVDVVDECLGKLENFVLTYNGGLIITADHGNVEEMINPHTGEINTEHSENEVPFIYVSQSVQNNDKELSEGILADIAPTVLSILGVEIPDSMTGRNLLDNL
jgi:2,3-bisphosphoglycerate-independent phosphoglycerate mutase